MKSLKDFKFATGANGATGACSATGAMNRSLEEFATGANVSMHQIRTLISPKKVSKNQETKGQLP